MREIKFRAWDCDREMFHRGNVSNLMIGMGGRLFWQFGLDMPKILDENEYPLEQFTGLKDKNGVEIYEGDILRHHDREEWSAAILAVEWDDRDCFFKLPHRAHLDQYEVVGNIHENPELIE